MADQLIQLPDALLKRRKRLQEEHGDGPDGEDQPTAQTPQKKDPPPADDDSEDDDTLVGGDDGVEPEVDTDLMAHLMGVVGEDGDKPADPPKPAVDPSLEQERQRLKEEREQLALDRAELEKARRTAAKPETKTNIVVPGTDPEADKAYAKSAPHIKHVALAAVAEQLDPILKDISERLHRLERTSDEVSAQATSASERLRSAETVRFEDYIRQHVGDVGPIVKSRRFAAFLNRAMPYMPGKKLRDAFGEAVKNRDAVTAVRILQSYAKTEEAAGRPIEAMTRAPASGGNENKLPNKGGSGKLPWSVRKDAWDKRRSGLMSAEDFEEIKKQYDVAEASGNIDYDA
ncbi:MAG: hypothetical protein ACK5MY_02480 [Jhaorihella sp.]